MKGDYLVCCVPVEELVDRGKSVESSSVVYGVFFNDWATVTQDVAGARAHESEEC